MPLHAWSNTIPLQVSNATALAAHKCANTRNIHMYNRPMCVCPMCILVQVCVSGNVYICVCLYVTATSDPYRMSIRQSIQMPFVTHTCAHILTHIRIHIHSVIFCWLAMCNQWAHSSYSQLYVCMSALCPVHYNLSDTFVLPYSIALHCVVVSANFAAPQLYLYIFALGVLKLPLKRCTSWCYLGTIYDNKNKFIGTDVGIQIEAIEICRDQIPYGGEK